MANKFEHLGADGQYNRRAWNRFLKGNKYGETPGFAEDGMPNGGAFPQAMEVVTTDNLALALSTQSPTPERPLFRPRFGYNMRAMGVQDVINVDGIYNPHTPNEDPNPGGPGEINSSSSPAFFNTIGQA